MAFFNEAWFIHAVNDNVTHLAQQKNTKTSGTVRTEEGLVGKTFPLQRLGSLEMSNSAARDADTIYLNPAQSKRRAVVRDFQAFVLIDDFDKIKELANAQSEFAMMLAYARNRKLDDIVISGLSSAAITVDEAAESTGTLAFPSGQIVTSGGGSAPMTMEKVRLTARLFDNADVDEDDRTMLISPDGVHQLLRDNTVTSSDYSTLRALEAGGIPNDGTWYGMRWRKSTRLPKTGNIRSAFAYQKLGVQLGIGLMTDISVDKAVHKNNNYQVGAKLSAGAGRADDLCVVRIDYDETL